LIEHALPDETRVWSQYAHLDRIMVSQAGQKVSRGQQIGTMGKGAKTAQYPQGKWIAHLHFEIRRNNLPIDNWLPIVRDKNAVLANYLNPTPYINARRPGQFAQTVETTVKQPDQIVIHAQSGNQEGAGVFRKSNTSDWYSAPYGFAGTMLWTYASAQEEQDWAEWRPTLPAAGIWQVWVYIPENYASTTYARYKIVHADGQTEAPVNQAGNINQWVLLGNYRFEAKGGYVRLSDLTGELIDGSPRMVGFDAVCWTRAG
jgi:hypothetical protein